MAKPSTADIVAAATAAAAQQGITLKEWVDWMLER